MARESSIERYLNRKIDAARVKSQLGEKGELVLKRTKINNESEIEKKIKRAHALFNNFIVKRTSILRGSDLNTHGEDFEISFEYMLLNLDIIDIPRALAIQTMDQLFLSTPGIVKTETGYKVVDKEKLQTYYGPEGSKARILKMMDKYKKYSVTDITKKIRMSRMEILNLLHQLETEGKIIDAGKKTNELLFKKTKEGE